MTSDWFEWEAAPKADFAVLGDPIGHSRSPKMHQAWLDATNGGQRYVAIRVPLDALEQALDRLSDLGYIGVNLTLPLKGRAAELSQSLDPIAARLGAVNTLRFSDRYGLNTDAPGFAKTLQPLSLSPGARVLLLGAGGAARGVAYALSELGVRLDVWNRNLERAETMVAELAIEATVSAQPEWSAYGLIVNATSGATGVNLPIDWRQVQPTTIAYDLMYGAPTPFLVQARERGLQTVDGLDMLVEQGALAMEFWTHRQVDRSVMLKAALS